MGYRKLTALLLAGSAFSALFAGTAAAQEGAAPTVDEVIVTARKVSENIQEVPISMSAVDGETLNRARLSTVEALNNIAPNVKIFRTVNNSSAFAVYIRGVGRNNGNFNVESPVALYVDDVIYPYQVGPVVDVGGIDRVEVLRGPQGTLYGRNATNGAVKYMTTRPNLGDDAYSFAVAVGTFGRVEAQTSLSMPLVKDQMAVKLDLGVRQYDGYLYDIVSDDRVNGTTSFSGRLSGLWQPTEQTEIYVAVDGTIARDPLTLNVPVVLNPATNEFEPRYGDYYTTAHAAPEINDLDVAGITVQGRLDVGPAQLRSITAYRGFDQRYANDSPARHNVPYTGVITDTEDGTFTQEFQATGGLFNDRVSYVAGLFYFNSLTRANVRQPAVAGTPTNDTRQLSTSTAGYFDTTVEVLERLNVSLGIRFTQDEKEIDQSRVVNNVLIFSKSGKQKWEATTPRVSVDYQVTDDILAYANWGKGFKAGQVNSIQPTSLAAAAVFVPPEETESAEVGLKTEWFERRLRLNADYFWTTYTNQTQAILVSGSTLLVFSDAEIQGLEVEMNARPFPAWAVSVNVGTLTSQYVNVNPSHPAFTLTDKTLQHAPELTYRIASEYTFDSLFGGSLTVGGDYDYISRTYQCLNHAPVCIMDEYEVLGAFATYAFPNDRFQLTLAGTNITGTEYFKLGSTNNTRGVAPPDEWSLTFKAKW